jgi:hypothetical protein
MTTFEFDDDDIKLLASCLWINLELLRGTLTPPAFETRPAYRPRITELHKLFASHVKKSE